MYKFFNPVNRTLYYIESDAGLVRFSLNVENAASMVQVTEYPGEETYMSPPKLRRDSNKGEDGLFFSKETKSIYLGRFDLEDDSNTDLIPVDDSFSYSC